MGDNYGWDNVEIIKHGVNMGTYGDVQTIQFGLKIYDMLRQPHLWVTTWDVGDHMGGLHCGVQHGLGKVI